MSFDEVRQADGHQVRMGWYPVLAVREAWDLFSMLELSITGIEHHYERGREWHSDRPYGPPGRLLGSGGG